jgi:hypothetical protein
VLITTSPEYPYEYALVMFIDPLPNDEDLLIPETKTISPPDLVREVPADIDTSEPTVLELDPADSSIVPALPEEESPVEIKKLPVSPRDDSPEYSDTFPDDVTFSLAECLKIAKSIASAVSHMHKFGIAHGDIYAHNIIHKGFSGVKLGDFGAAYFMPSELKDRLTRIDWRGFSFLLDDLLSRCKEGCGGGSGGKDVARLELETIRNECLKGEGEDAVKILKGVFEKR